MLVPCTEESLQYRPEERSGTLSCHISSDFSDAGVLRALYARHAADKASIGGISMLSQVRIVFG